MKTKGETEEVKVEVDENNVNYIRRFPKLDLEWIYCGNYLECKTGKKGYQLTINDMVFKQRFKIFDDLVKFGEDYINKNNILFEVK